MNDGIRSHPVTLRALEVQRQDDAEHADHEQRRTDRDRPLAESRSNARRHADATAEARLQGIVVRPALSALNPSPTWSMRLKVKKNAGMPAMNTAEIATPTLKDLMRNSESCTSGNRVDGSERSYRMKSASITGLSAMQMKVQARPSGNLSLDQRVDEQQDARSRKDDTADSRGAWRWARAIR